MAASTCRGTIRWGEKSLSLGARIRELRKARGLTARALAEKIGVHPQHLFSLERGRFRPSLETLEKIAEALGVTVGDLFAEPDRKPKLKSDAFWDNYLAYARQALGQSEPRVDQPKKLTMDDVVRLLSSAGLDPEDVFRLGLVVADILRRRTSETQKSSPRT